MSKVDLLIQEMINYYAGDPKRIQHFIKVHSFAKQIGEMEDIRAETLEVLEAAAVVHDIGIKEAEGKFGSCSGKLQEQEGPAPALAMLTKLGFDQELVKRVCYLVGHHHTYTDIDGIDYRILVEADFLVNMYEESLNKDVVSRAYTNIFRTESGKWICRTMFGLNDGVR